MRFTAYAGLEIDGIEEPASSRVPVELVTDGQWLKPLEYVDLETPRDGMARLKIYTSDGRIIAQGSAVPVSHSEVLVLGPEGFSIYGGLDIGEVLTSQKAVRAKLRRRWLSVAALSIFTMIYDAAALVLAGQWWWFFALMIGLNLVIFWKATGHYASLRE